MSRQLFFAFPSTKVTGLWCVSHLGDVLFFGSEAECHEWAHKMENA
jgi:hypothetical protein